MKSSNVGYKGFLAKRSNLLDAGGRRLVVSLDCQANQGRADRLSVLSGQGPAGCLSCLANDRPADMFATAKIAKDVSHPPRRHDKMKSNVN